MDTQSLLPAVWEVPTIFRRRLGKQVGRQRAMFADGHLLLVLHDPPLEDDTNRTGRFFWRQPDGTWSSTMERGAGVGSLAKLLDLYVELLTKLDEAEHRASNADDYFQILTRLGPVHRATRNLHQVLQEARELVKEDRDIIDLRDRAYQLERTGELLKADVDHGLGYYMARRAEEQAQAGHQMSVAAHRLNVLAAFFFPIATLTAIFGTNLKHGFEEQYKPWLFVAILAVGLISGFVLKSAITKKVG